MFDLVKKVTVESTVKIPLYGHRPYIYTYMSVVKAGEEDNTNFVFVRLCLF